jgi:germacradienol/geosmin synthase
MQPFELPEFYMPYPVHLNPHQDSAREHVKAWAREMRMLDPEFGVWDEPGFDSADFGLFAALTHPDASAPRLDLMSDWHVWAFFADDAFIETFKRTRDLAGAKAFISGLRAFMPADPALIPLPAGPVERGLADLWRRTAPSMPADLRARFAGAVMDFTGSWLWELANLTQNRVPDPVDYIEMRRRTGGAAFSITLARHTLGEELPPQMAGAAPMRALADTFADIGHLRNDIFSYHKETEHEGEFSNGVLVMERFLDCDPQQAAGVVNDLVTCRMRQFERVVTGDLPALFDELGLSPQDRGKVLAYVKGLQDWMAGDLQWAEVTGRYTGARSRDLPAAGRLSGRPAGLGTSAARIEWLRRVAAPVRVAGR